MPKTIKTISYWPIADIAKPPAQPFSACFIHHTAHGDEAYLAGCQAKLALPSACVWMIPGTEG